MITAEEARNKSKQLLSTQKENTEKWIKELFPSIEQYILGACSLGSFEVSMDIIIKHSEKMESVCVQADNLRLALEKFGYEVKLSGSASKTDKSEYNYVLLLKWHPRPSNDYGLNEKFVLREL